MIASLISLRISGPVFFDVHLSAHGSPPRLAGSRGTLRLAFGFFQVKEALHRPAVVIGFGHSILAMSGEESLAQVYREIERPKVKNLQRAGMVIFLYSLLFAGHETTTTLISNATRQLLINRDSWEAIKADQTKIPGAIEEVLRSAGSIVAWRRTAERDAVCHAAE